MRLVTLAAIAFALTLAAAAPASAGISIRFVNPERYSDEDFRRPAERERLLREFDKTFQQLAGRHIRPGQTLRIEVLDIDLAGRIEPWRRRLDDVRIMRETTPPAMKLRYVLEERGRTVRRGEETLLDWNYLSNVSARNSSEWLPYEKAMLRDWFRRRFGEARPH